MSPLEPGEYLLDWVRAYAATLVIEVPIVSGWLWPRCGRAAVGWGVLASTLTHPVLWFLWPQWGPYWLWVGSAEVSIWLFEGVLYAWVLRDVEGRIAWWRGFGISGLANGSSLLAGWVMRAG